LFEEGKNRQSNLRFGGSWGNTVEFWTKGIGYSSPGASSVVFDAWNTGSLSGSSDWAKFTIAAIGSYWSINYQSGSDGIADYLIAEDNIQDDSWHHYAFTLVPSGSATQIKYYRDGTLISSSTSGTDI